MPISFNDFPQNWRIPLFWLEVDPSQAGLPVRRQPALIAGQMLTASAGASLAGTATPDVPISVGSLAQAKALFGEGSMLERMFARFFDNAFGQEVWAAPVAEPAAGAKAHGVLVVAQPPTDAGTLFLYIAGQQVVVGIAANDNASSVAASIVTAINAMATLPVVAALTGTSSASVTLTCKWKGSTGNDIYISANYYGAIGGETYPPRACIWIDQDEAPPAMTAGPEGASVAFMSFARQAA